MAHPTIGGYKRELLCVGSLMDKTFSYSVERFRQAGAAIDVIDIFDLILNGEWDFRTGLAGGNLILKVGEREVSRSTCDPIFCRILWFDDGAPTTVLRNKVRQNLFLLETVLSRWPAPVVFRPRQDGTNRSKVAHSRIAQSLGLRIPKSCLTNSPMDARAFIDGVRKDGRGVIYKGASSFKTIASQLFDHDLERLEQLDSAPVLFQENIIGPDIRVHVVGDKIVPEAVLSSQVDYRFARNKRANRYASVDLPTVVAKSCLELSKYVGSGLSGIDFKFDVVTGDWFFLEANSLPCYQGYDRRAGGSISEAILDVLAMTYPLDC